MTAITTYGRPPAPISYFKYLGRILSASENNWPAVVRNLRQAQKNWERMTHVLGREGADAQTLGMLYVVLVQAVLIYVLET